MNKRSLCRDAGKAMSKSREKGREHILSKENLEGIWNVSMTPDYATRKVTGLNMNLECSNPAVNANPTNNTCYTNTQWPYNGICDVNCKDVPWLWFPGVDSESKRLHPRETCKQSAQTHLGSSRKDASMWCLRWSSLRLCHISQDPSLAPSLTLLSLVSFILVYSLGCFSPLLLFLPLWGPQFYLVQEIMLIQLSINMRNCCPCFRKKIAWKRWKTGSWALACNAPNLLNISLYSLCPCPNLCMCDMVIHIYAL